MIEDQTNRKHIGFWTNNSEEDKKLVKYIELHKSSSSALFVKGILLRFMQGEFTELTEKETLIIAKLKAEIRLKNAMADIKEREFQHWKVFETEPSNKAKGAIKKGVTEGSPSCFDEKNHRFDCPECDSKFVFAEDQHDIQESKEQFIDHYYQQHGEVSPKLQRELIDLK